MTEKQKQLIVHGFAIAISVAIGTSITSAINRRLVKPMRHIFIASPLANGQMFLRESFEWEISVDSATGKMFIRSQ